LKNNTLRTGLVGNGRVAQHYRFYLETLGVPFCQWSRAQGSETSPAQALGECHRILVLIKDSAIEPMVQELRALPGFANKTFIHFSGSLVTPLAEGAHPLMTFGQELYPADVYPRIAFVTEKGRMSFSELFPDFPNPSFEIPPEAKPYYHALCVMGGNFTTLLWQKFFAEMETRFGIPATATLPYMDRIFANLRERPGSALTGPFARGDRETTRKNQEALAQAGDAYEGIYQAFVQAAGGER
jgi:predicted short-subunit dehydrogenase-like oxidoreductase (DUF2520 family)